MAAEWRFHLLKKVVRALPATTYEVRLVTQPRDGTTGKCIKVLNLSPDEFVKHHAQFGRWSAQKLHVFFRPVGGVTHVLLDLDTPDALHEVLNLAAGDGLRPSLVVETSPGRHQLWFSLPGRNHNVSVHRAACRLLAERYGGDPGSAKPTQLGRLPGTMNPKPSRAMPDGAPPLVETATCGESHGMKFDASFRSSKRLLADALERAERDRIDVPTFDVPRDLPDHGLSEDELGGLFDEAVEQRGGDRSAADFDIALLARRAGDSPERAVALLMAGSAKAAEREAQTAGAGRAYAERTVRSAWQVADQTSVRTSVGRA